MAFQTDPFIAPLCEEEIVILFQDDALLVINKPTKLLTLSGKHQVNKDSAHARLLKDYPSAAMIHRLDFGTSGLMVVALSKAVNAHISEQFAARTIVKKYIALLDGHVELKTGDVNIALAKGEFPLHKVCKDTGKEAVSHYEVLSYHQHPCSTRVEFSPKTGRTHQLRLHSQYIGHAILGCDLYDLGDSRAKADRLMLHASELSFIHPLTGKPLFFKCEAPF